MSSGMPSVSSSVSCPGRWSVISVCSAGVRRSVDYLLSHPELQIEEPEFDAWCDGIIEKIERIKELKRI